MFNFLRDPTSKSSKYLSLAVDLFYLNLLFIITSIPIFSIFSGLIAVHNVTSKLIDEKSSSITKEYFKALRANFLRGLEFEIIFAFIIMLIYTSFSLVAVMSGIVKLIVYVALGLLVVITILDGLYLLGYTARYKDTLFNSFKVCFQVALLNRQTTLYLFGIIGFVFSCLTLGDGLFAFTSFILFLGGISAITMIFNHFVIGVFTQYEV